VTRLDVLYRLLKELIQGKLHLKEGGREGGREGGKGE